ncbi:glycerol-3-phosphate responsive antiterminator [Proteiniclasticum sp.]|jgi:glycerol uptake operon antiterminator|uniref:glycerol-3-phosphate responsive antiterminator n=1 Tax=Proteiniclasticum sp. TaxID=2053595 RepID=UPI000E916E4D|nr:glycerol-3-phosphate responsive antiterminator [Proteiniclasticum sp.]HBW14166.1 glycerol-3-phosphate responsive antiterminator [Proteiniclasticum sp.]
MKEEFYTALEDFPVVTAVKDFNGLEMALETENKVVFVLFGNITDISMIVKKIKAKNKIAIVHVDLIEGLGSKEIAAKFIKYNTLADGIISTKANIISAAKDLGLITVQRFFLIDSLSLKNVIKYIEAGHADTYEVLPGGMYKIITMLSNISSVPLIAGGLISDKEDVISALSAGATAISSTDTTIWTL